MENERQREKYRDKRNKRLQAEIKRKSTKCKESESENITHIN